MRGKLARGRKGRETVETNKTDVLIIGAGPAGCALGYLLRQAGHDTLIVEALDVAAKDKLCGGVLTKEAQRHVADIYGADALEELRPYGVRKLVLTSFEAKMPIPVSYAVLPRRRFDDFCLGRYLGLEGRLLDRARLVGVDDAAHVANVRLAGEHDELEIRYETIVGADGAASTLRRLLCGRMPRVTPSLQGELAQTSPDAMAGLKPTDQGVCWYIPQGGTAVVGSLFHHANAAFCKERLVGFCSDLNIGVPKLRGAVLPTGDDVQLRAGSDAWFVGDAAGLIDAFTGSGIHHALYSARMLAASLLGGAPYEEAMASRVREIESAAAKEPAANMRACLQIALAAR